MVFQVNQAPAHIAPETKQKKKKTQKKKLLRTPICKQDLHMFD
jgi:hypothetical protein